ncbi:MAG: ion transporter [Rubrivivax sp.]|nr:ion transporter [Rubrivivax sp.]
MTAPNAPKAQRVPNAPNAPDASDAPRPPGDLRSRLGALLERPWFQHGILALIIVNAIILGLETSAGLRAEYGALLGTLDRTILAVFVAEIALRLFVHRAAFWRDPWSLFDFAVVAIALAPATGQFAVLRALRVLRVLRILTIVPSMRRVVGGLLAAIPGLSSIAMVLALVFYVFAVITTNLFGASFPDWFGTLGRSLYTLFQVMTLESWSMGIVRPVMEVYPYAWGFFIPFILIATFTMLNLFIGIIVSAMQSFTDADKAETIAAVEGAREHIEADLHAEVRALRGEIAELRGLLRQRAAGAGAGTEGAP